MNNPYPELLEQILNEIIRIIHPSSENLYFKIVMKEKKNQLSNKIARQRNWNKYDYLCALTFPFKYFYCVTVHIAQGSTFHSVLVDYDDIMLNNNCEEKLKCLYTSSTRASHYLSFLIR